MTASYQKFFDPATIAKLRGAKLRTRSLIEGFLEGLHRSPFRGFSTDFAEHREYVVGDDTRYIDWKVFARTDKYYLKQFEDETNLICYLVVDVSGSMQYQSEQAALSKLEYAQCLAATISWMVLRQQDAIAVATADNRIRQQLPAGSQASQLTRLANIFDSTKSHEDSSLERVFRQLAEVFKKRGVVFVLSDLFDDPAQVLAGLQRLRLRKHDIVVCHILDPAEVEFPFDSATRFRDLEDQSLTTIDAQVYRDAYLREFSQFRQQMERECHRLGCRYAMVRTDMPIDQVIRQHTQSQ